MVFPRIRVFALWAGLACVAGGALPTARASTALDDLTGPWHLFVDDFIVAAKTGLARTYHPFQKHAGNPVLVADEPWEFTIVYIYGTVMHDATGGYRMWYHTLRLSDPNDTGSNILYATSSDGIHWDKPALGIREWNGSTANNMFFTRPTKSGITSVMHTPWDPDPARQYKFMNKDNDGYWAAWSPDGIHVTDSPLNPVFTGGSDVGQFTWDPHTQRFLGYVKNNSYVNDLRRRSVALTTTTDIETWPAEELILEVDSYDDRWVPSGTVQRTHLYGLSAFPYESMYMGFLWIFRATDVDGYYLGPVFAEIVSSHDGITWTREEGTRLAMLPLGPAGAWDDGQLYTARAPVLDGDTLKIYYGACDKEHGTALNQTTCAIGLATLRKDGFASLDAGATPGTVTTKGLAWASGALRVNCTASAGWLKAEVLDDSGNVVPGYGLAACNPVQGNGVDQVVTWVDRVELPTDVAPIRIRFTLQNASLYSFAVGDGARIIQPPTITRHPTDQTTLPGGSASFSVRATGSWPLSFQWQKNGVDLAEGGHFAGTTTMTLRLAGIGTGDAGTYACRVMNPFGEVVSGGAVLHIRVASFAGVGIAPGGTASTVSGITADGSVVCGTSASKAFLWTETDGLKSLALPVGATTATAAGVGIYNGAVVLAAATNASTYRAKRWDGNTLGTGTWSNLPRMDGSLEWNPSGLGTDGAANLWIAGSSVNGGDGNGRQAGRYRQSTGTTDSFALPSLGHDHSDFHAASDTGGFGGQYQYRGTAPAGGARNAMKSAGASPCTGLNTLLGAPTTSTEAVVKAISRNGLVQAGWSYYAGGGANPMPCLWNNSTTPTAIAFLPGGDGDNSGEVLALNGDGTLAGGYTYYAGSPSGPREAFLWDALNGTRHLQTALASQYGLDLSGWTLQEVRAISADGMVLAGNGLHNGVSEGWVVRFVAYVPEPPVITEHPQPRQVCAGETAYFSVGASGIGLSYRWQKDEADLIEDGRYVGTATPILTVSDVTMSDAGDYRCVVTNGGGSVPSNAAALTVRATAPADFDHDCDVDLGDFASFQACFNGPNRTYPQPGCSIADLDGDADVDLADFAAFQACFNGPNRPPACL